MSLFDTAPEWQKKIMRDSRKQFNTIHVCPDKSLVSNGEAYLHDKMTSEALGAGEVFYVGVQVSKGRIICVGEMTYVYSDTLESFVYLGFNEMSRTLRFF